MRSLLLSCLLIVAGTFQSCKKTTLPLPVAPHSEARVLVNGHPLSLTVSPIVNGQLVMIPAGEVLEYLGFTCTENPIDNTVVCTKGGESVVFIAGSFQAIVNQNEVFQLASPYYINDSILMVEVRILQHFSNFKLDWDEESQSVQLYDYDELDVGLYFYDDEPGDWGDWDAVGCQKFEPGVENPFFDPAKPTIIWSVGWQSDGTIWK